MRIPTLFVPVAILSALPVHAGQASSRGESVAAVLQDSVDSGTLEGVSVAFGMGTSVSVVSAGDAALEDVWDLASLTKPVATAASIMALVEDGKLALDARVADLLPAFTGEGKAEVTVEHLLLHTSGLAPANALSDFDQGAEAGLAKILGSPLRSSPGEAFAYSDLGFIALGEIVETVAGAPLEDFARDRIFARLGMGETAFGSTEPLALGERVVATDPSGEGRGVVHDPRARALGGVAGHAGLFAPLTDLMRFARMLAGEDEGSALRPETLREWTRPRFLPGGVVRGLGLDIDSRFSSPRGTAFPRYRSFGHTGFTGPCFWVDPSTGAWFVMLASRLRHDPAPSMTPLRRRLADAVGRELGLASGATADVVLTGIDVLAAEDCERLEGRRVGLITNVTGRAADGRRTIDVLHGSDNVRLERLFSPEHGLYAKLEGSVGDAVDEVTGLPVFSLYGDTRKPTPEMLAGLDAVVFDIQDIGVRFYTYISTLGLTMEACAEAGVTVIVLDRPNPLTGLRVEGPVIDRDRLSFIGWRPLPVTHGMTVGEIAHLFRDEWGGIPAEVEVVQMAGWDRSLWWEETGVRWINPSPNMRNPSQAVLYPCVGLLEGANLSVGRGTDEPFERFGAPWIDGPRLAATIRAAGLAGLDVTAIEFTPDASKFEGELCQGVQITVTDRDALRPVVAGLTLARLLVDLFPDDFEADKADARLMSRRAWQAAMTVDDPGAVDGTWSTDLEAFKALRARHLLYGGPR